MICDTFHKTIQMTKSVNTGRQRSDTLSVLDTSCSWLSRNLNFQTHKNSLHQAPANPFRSTFSKCKHFTENSATVNMLDTMLNIFCKYLLCCVLSGQFHENCCYDYVNSVLRSSSNNLEQLKLFQVDITEVML